MTINVKEALQRASFLLKDAGMAEPRREAAALLRACLAKTYAWLFSHDDYVLDNRQERLFFGWVERRISGEPYAYLCGEKEFLGYPFYVSPAVLIPRPETELLVEEAVKRICAINEPRVLEIGCGSGAVAVTLALLLPDAKLTAVDISGEALDVAARNAARHQVQNRVTLSLGDLYGPVANEDFDALVSNPPYIPRARLFTLPSDVRDYEPHLALCGGEDGLHYYRRLMTEIGVLRQRPPIIALEIGQGQASAVEGILASAGYANIRRVRDLAAIDRVLIASMD